MSVLDLLIGLMAPHLCVGCEREGSLLCVGCTVGLQNGTGYCYRCGNKSSSDITCAECYKYAGIEAVYAATPYHGIAKDIVWRLKSGGARAAARTMAIPMSRLVNNKLRTVLVPVPTSTRRRRQRGYDQALLLARELSRLTGLPALQCLARLGNQHQVGASRTQRLEQLTQAYRVTQKPPPGYTVILVDDVITTGATFESAARELHKAGVRTIEAIAFARA